MSFSNRKFLIWGAKGQAKVLDEIIRFYNGEVVALVDKNASLVSPLSHLPILDGLNGYRNWLKEASEVNESFNYSAIAAIGGDKGRDRHEYLKIFQNDGLETPSLIHPKSHITDTAKVGDNCQLCAFSFVGADVLIGDACIVNSKASIDHESTLGDGVHLAPGVTVCGEVNVGDYVFVGAGAVILPNISIGKNSYIGAGSVVTKNVPQNVMVYGNPAKVIRMLNFV